MSITVPMPVSGFPSGSDRLVSTRIRGVLVALPCFDWCVEGEGHHGEDHFHVEDFTHVGEAVEVALPTGEELFSARLMASPHCGTGDTKVAVDYDGASAELGDPAEIEALADRLVSAASRLRGMARRIGGAA